MWHSGWTIPWEGPASFRAAYADHRRMRIWGLSKQAARYQTAPERDVRCDHCKYMFPPLAIGGCRLVRGVIRGSATCDEFRPRART
jgi:hypothetical protein